MNDCIFELKMGEVICFAEEVSCGELHMHKGYKVSHQTEEHSLRQTIDLSTSTSMCVGGDPCTSYFQRHTGRSR